MNRNTIISIILGLILIGAIGGYFVFYKSGPTAPAPQATVTDPSTLPIGTPKPVAVTVGATTTPTQNETTDEVGLKSIRGFYQLTNKAIAGATNDIYSSSGVNNILFAEKATSHIYRVNPIDRKPNRLTITTIPRINQVWWGQNKNQPTILIYHTDKDGVDQWFNATLKITSTGDGELVGSNLDQNIFSLDISPDGKNIAYLKTEGQNIIGTTFNIESGKKMSVFKSAFRDWNISWTSLATIILNSKPAASIPGLALSLNPQTTQTKTALENISGLTTLMSLDGKKILWSESAGSANIKLSVYTEATKKNLGLDLSTLPEKCTWSKDNIHVYCGVPNPLPLSSYPDNWYSGEISFSDTLWKINTDTGATTVLLNPSLENLDQTVDVYQPFLSADEKYLFLTNKNDLTLWALDLGQES